MGLAERSDALVVVVSEERGTISLFANGQHDQMQATDKITRSIQEHIEGESKQEDPERARQRKTMALEITASVLLVLAVRLLLSLRA